MLALASVTLHLSSLVDINTSRIQQNLILTQDVSHEEKEGRVYAAPFRVTVIKGFRLACS